MNTEHPAKAEEMGDTPMGRVWVIVLGTMVLVTAASFLWHYMGILKLRSDEKVYEDRAKTNIERLTAFRAELEASSTPTSKIAPK